MELSFDFKFSGAGVGLCSLTIGTVKHGDPNITGYVIICSQKRNYSGISITNALETIAAQLFNNIWKNELKMIAPSGNPKILHGLLGTWLKDLREKNSRNLGDIYQRKNAVWVEHYPAGTGIVPGDSFMEVRFDPEGFPTWLPARKTLQAQKVFGNSIIQAAVDYSRKN